MKSIPRMLSQWWNSSRVCSVCDETRSAYAQHRCTCKNCSHFTAGWACAKIRSSYAQCVIKSLSLPFVLFNPIYWRLVSAPIQYIKKSVPLPSTLAYWRQHQKKLFVCINWVPSNSGECLQNSLPRVSLGSQALSFSVFYYTFSSHSTSSRYISWAIDWWTMYIVLYCTYVFGRFCAEWYTNIL